MPIINNKVTLGVHLFWSQNPNYVKLPLRKDFNWTDIYKNPADLSMTSKEFLIDAGIPEQQTKFFDRLYERYCQAIHFAKDSLLIIVREDDGPEEVPYARDLFDFAMLEVLPENLLFIPPRGGEVEDNCRGIKRAVLKQAGSLDNFRDLQLYAFGEAPDACLPGITCDIQRGLINKAKIIGSFCWTESILEARREVGKPFWYRGKADTDDSAGFADQIEIVWEPNDQGLPVILPSKSY